MLVRCRGWLEPRNVERLIPFESFCHFQQIRGSQQIHSETILLAIIMMNGAEDSR